MKYELSEASFTFTQEEDSDDASGYPQSLTVAIHDAGAGHFITIATQRWAFDSPEELTALVSCVRERLGNWWR